MSSATLSPVRDARPSTAVGMPVSLLAVSWILMFPLIYYASSGTLWFDGGSANNRLASVYGALANDSGESPYHNVMLLALFGLSALAFFPKLIALGKMLIEDRIFPSLVLWAAASFLWSQSPSDTLKTAVYVALNTVFAFYVVLRFTPDQQTRLLMLLGWICLALTIVLSLFFPQYGIDNTLLESSWKGMYGQKNLCSMTTSFLMIAGLYAQSRNRAFNLMRAAFVLLSVFVVLMTASGTGKICLAVIFAHYLFMRFIATVRPERRGAVLIGVAVSVLVLVAVGSVLAPIVLRMLGKDPTLTGRTDIWQSVIQAIRQRPIQGYGYSAFWRGYSGASADIALANHWAVTSAHNAYLEVWLNLGLVGVVLVVLAILRALRDAFICIRAGSTPYIGFCTAILVLTLVTSADEGELMVPNNLMWILFIIACVGLSVSAKRVRQGLANE